MQASWRRSRVKNQPPPVKKKGRQRKAQSGEVTIWGHVQNQPMYQTRAADCHFQTLCSQDSPWLSWGWWGIKASFLEIKPEQFQNRGLRVLLAELLTCPFTVSLSDHSRSRSLGRRDSGEATFFFFFFILSFILIKHPEFHCWSQRGFGNQSQIPGVVHSTTCPSTVFFFNWTGTEIIF